MRNTDDSISLRAAVARMPQGHVFAMSDLEHLCSYDALRKGLSRLSQEGKIVRVVPGIYRHVRKDSFLAQIQPTPLMVAQALARNNDWIIVPGTERARYLLGLSQYEPSDFLCYSTGPTSQYIYGNDQTIYLKQCSKKFMYKMSEYPALLTSALLDLTTYPVSPYDLLHLSDIISEEHKELIMAEREYAPLKVQAIFEIVCGQYGRARR